MPVFAATIRELIPILLILSNFCVAKINLGKISFTKFLFQAIDRLNKSSREKSGGTIPEN